MLARDVLPVIPGQGSVGASGDLAPLAHMAAAMIGEGEAIYGGERLPAAEALAPGRPRARRARRQGGPRAHQRHPGLDRAGARRPLRRAPLPAGGAGHRRALDRRRHGLVRALPPARSTRCAATAARSTPPPRWRACSTARRSAPSHLEGDEPRAGSLLHPLPAAGRRRRPRPPRARSPPPSSSRRTRVTDNPLVLSDDQVVSGGNFHAEPVAFAADILALAVCEIGAIAQRRIALLVDPALSFGLPAFLAPEPGLNSGLMIAEVTSAALMSENKQLAHPASVDSTPTSANQEDHVSMACHGARRLGPMVANLDGHPRHRGARRRPGHRVPRAAHDQPAAARGGGARSRAACPRSTATASSPPTSPPRRRWSPRAPSRRRSPICCRASMTRSLGDSTMDANPRHNQRDSSRRTGTELNAKSWLTEAPLRMLMNNLDPEVAERPHELVVYGGIGRAARNWDDFDRIVDDAEDAGGRRDAARPVGQAGRRLPHPRGRAAGADRQLQPRAALGDLGAFQRARSQGPDDVRPDDRRLLDLHRQPRASCRAPTRPSSRRAASTTAATSRAAGC